MSKSVQIYFSVSILALLLIACGTEDKPEPVVPAEAHPDMVNEKVAKLETEVLPKPEPPEPAPKATKMVLIIIDALRADRLGSYGFKEMTSPTIDGLAKEGILFETLHAASPWTAPSFGSIFTGVSPSVHGAGGMLAKGSSRGTSLFGVTVGGIRKDLPTLPKMLPKGMVTAGVVNNAFVSEKLGFKRGFDHFDHRNASIHRYRKADGTTKKALAWLKENKQKSLFLLIHYFDPHMGYGPPDQYVQMFAPDKPRRISVPFTDHDAARDGTLKPSEPEKTFIRGLYNGEVRFVDDQVALLKDAMQGMGLLDDTWLVITSDHGEEQFEHGSFEHGHAYEEEVTLVPLIIRAPGGKWRAGTRVAASVRHIDIPPTILELFGMDIPTYFEGQSLLPLINGEDTADRIAYIEFNLFHGQQCALFDGRYKIIWDTRRKRGYYYDLKEDPMEMKRLDSKEPLYTELLERLQKKRSQLKKASKGKVANKAKLSGEAAKALKALGYIE
ncbi:MAG: sulfatase-like hydrolase/transferase [Proteobacteria bacterium]|nr:sulfatase-like hydrolase/transferase [Pseudomonadota bacterium]